MLSDRINPKVRGLSSTKSIAFGKKRFSITGSRERAPTRAAYPFFICKW